MIEKLQKVLPYAIAIIILAYLTHSGLNYEGAEDTVIRAYINGFYNGGTNALPDTFGLFIIISSPLNWLHNHLPHVEWYDLFQLVLLLTAYIFLAKALLGKNQSVISLFVSAIFGLLIAAIFFKPITLTKTAILLSGSVLLQMQKKQSGVLAVFCCVLLFLAFLIRIESGVLALAIAGVYFFFEEFISQPINTKLLTAVVLPLLILTAISLWMNHPKTPEETYYKQIRPYEFTLTDFDREKSAVELQNTEDSVKFEACVNFFFADSSECNVPFFKKIGVVNSDKTPVSLVKRALSFSFNKNKLEEFAEVLNACKWLLLIWLISILLVNSVQIHFRNLTANAACIALLIIIALLLKPEEHVIAPGLGLMILFNIRGIANQRTTLNASTFIVPMLFLLIAFSFLELRRESYKERIEKEKAVYYNSIVSFLKTQPNKNVVLNIGVWDEEHRRMFEKDQFPHLPRTFVLDGAILYFDGNYQHLLETVTGKRSFISHWEYFIETQPTLFVSSAYRMNIILKYINTIYRKNYTASAIKSFGPSPYGTQPIEIFEVKQHAE